MKEKHFREEQYLFQEKDSNRLFDLEFEMAAVMGKRLLQFTKKHVVISGCL